MNKFNDFFASEASNPFNAEFGEWLKLDDSKVDNLKKNGKRIKELERIQKEMSEQDDVETSIEHIKDWDKKRVSKRDDIIERQKEMEKKLIEDMPDKPDISVVCVDNTGYEECFEVGVNYLFKRVEEDGFWLVEDMNGEDQFVFSERFDVVDVQPPWRLIESTMELVYDPPDDAMEEMICENCMGTGTVVEMVCYGNKPIDNERECRVCEGTGVIKVPVMRYVSSLKQQTVDYNTIKNEIDKISGELIPISKRSIEEDGKEEMSTESIESGSGRENDLLNEYIKVFGAFAG